MTIEFSLIAKGDRVLCSHQIGSGSFEDVVKSMLPNIPTRTNARTTYTSNNHSFHVMIESAIIYMCAATPEFGKRQPYAFLDEIKKRFEAGSLTTRAEFAGEHELDRDFAQVLSGQMERFSNGQGGGGGDTLSTLQTQVDDVKGIMSQNIEKVLARGERLDELLDKTTDLEAHSATFRTTARRVHRKMWCKNLKMTICIAAIVTTVILVITLIILFSTGVLPPKSGSSTPTTTVKPTTLK